MRLPLTAAGPSGGWYTRGRKALPTSCGRSFRHSSSGASSTSSWETVVGLEIHAQLKTNTKLFSRAPLRHDDMPNNNVEPLDAAFPGALPVVNSEAIRLSVLTALSLGCRINPRSTFDRKHYFYHDIPASYQITQHYNPIARHGRLEVASPSRNFSVGIQQLQIEQDTAKSQKVGGDRLIDLNRAGAGLMEIVTEPDMRSAEEAGAFVRRLQSLLRRVGSGDGDMEKGNLRVDVNVSVRRPGAPFGTRCEIKNLNSVRYLQQAIAAEAKRHIAHYEATASPLRQETRGLDESTGETYTLRAKEDVEDYRYMPDSNLPAIVIPPHQLEQLGRAVPELPWVTTQRLVESHGLALRDAETLLGLDEYGGKGVAYFEQVALAVGGRNAVNWMIHEVLGLVNKSGVPWQADLVPAPLLAEVVTAVSSAQITSATARQVLKQALAQPTAAISLAERLDQLGLASSDDAPDLSALCAQAIDKLPSVAASVRNGNERVVMRLVGEVMKLSGGRADAQEARRILLSLLKP